MKHEVVAIDGLGYFSLQGREAGRGTNPQTGEVLTLPAVSNVFKFIHTIGLNKRLEISLPAEIEKNHIPFLKTNFPRIQELQRLIEESKNADRPFNIVHIRTSGGDELLKITSGKERRNIRYEDGSLNDTEHEWLKVSAGKVLKDLIRDVPPSPLRNFHST